MGEREHEPSNSTSLSVRRIIDALLKPRVILSVMGLVAAILLGTALLGADASIAVWGFRLFAILGSVPLTIVTFRLARRDLRRATRARGPASAAPIFIERAAEFDSQLRVLRYLRVSRSSSAARYVRNPWGYAGPAILHAGMLAVLAAVLLVTLTDSVGVLTVFEGEIVEAGTPLESVTRGPLGAEAVVDADLMVDALMVTYWPSGEPRRIVGTYTWYGTLGPRTFDVAVNAPVVVDGVRFFQEQRVGYAFALTVTQGDDEMLERLDMPLPPSANEPSYLDTVLPNGDLLRAKCFHDPESADGSPELVLRLVRDGETVGERSFADQAAGLVGDLHINIDARARWAVITMERSVGYTPLFASFFVIFIGAFLIYATPPREVTLTRHVDGTIRADWHAPRFATLYADEERRLRNAASREGDH